MVEILQGETTYELALEAALSELLDVAERIRGGDPNLNPERWYAARGLRASRPEARSAGCGAAEHRIRGF